MLASAFWTDRKITGYVEFYAVPVIKQRIAAEITQIMQQCISKDSLLVLTKDDLGNITNVQVDAAKMSKTKAQISE